MKNDLPGSLRGGVTIGEAVAAVSAALRASGVEDAEGESRQIVCAALAVTRIDLLLRAETPADPQGLNNVRELADRRMRREPLSRILGRRGFWDLEIAVYPDVLDPRPDSEAVIEAALDAMGDRREQPLRILDAGTGSGALIAGLLSAFPRAIGWAVDISPAAVEAANANLRRLGFANRATVLRQDWREPLPVPFDLVVSNPPYIETAAIATLDREVREHDPVLALDGGLDGLDAYRSLARLASGWIRAEGTLVVEIGAGQAAGVKTIFGEAGARLTSLRQDYGGRDRAMVWTWSGI